MRCLACNILQQSIKEDTYCVDCQAILDIPEEKHFHYCLEDVEEGVTEMPDYDYDH